MRRDLRIEAGVRVIDRRSDLSQRHTLFGPAWRDGAPTGARIITPAMPLAKVKIISGACFKRAFQYHLE
jgi:hypothetical protein